MASPEKIKSLFEKYLHPNDSGVNSNKESATPSFGGGGGNGGNTMETRVSLLEHKVSNIETILERIESKIDKMDAKFEDKFAKMDDKLHYEFSKFDAKYDAKVDKIYEKFDKQTYYILGIYAMLISLFAMYLFKSDHNQAPAAQQPIPQQYYQQQPQQPQIIYMMAPPSPPAPVTQH
jgi:hypothetical protein